MKRNRLILVMLLLAVSCGSPKYGSARHQCRAPDDPLDPCDDNLYCSSNNICLECGGESQPCCEGKNTDGCNPPFICKEDGRCGRCGAKNTPCCANGWCGQDLFCDADNLCATCGSGEGVPCCESAYCYGGQSCVEGICTNQLCDDSGSCQSCGRMDEQCCGREVCAANSTCGADMICRACGGKDEPACVNQMCGYWQRDLVTFDYTACECDAWFTNVNGICGIPWKADPQAGVEVCLPRAGYADTPLFEVNAPSTSDIEHREWCFWYAAYFKNDRQLCENIQWGEMQEKCEQGENPEEYFVWIKVKRD